MDNIQNALGSQYLMFFHPAMPSDQFSPMLDLDCCLHAINRAIDIWGDRVSGWPSWEAKREAAKLVRASWIYQNLDNEPIRKPLLVHLLRDGKMEVDCGDTRLMAIELKQQSLLVPAVTTCLKDQAHRFANWWPISTDRELLYASGLWINYHCSVKINGGSLGADRAFDWLEISSPLTQHHMHDPDRRVRMLENFLGTKYPGFRFDQHNARECINWFDYDS
jgi:hypothetical protein